VLVVVTAVTVLQRPETLVSITNHGIMNNASYSLKGYQWHVAGCMPTTSPKNERTSDSQGIGVAKRAKHT
jgi:hypothetical protein